MFGILIASNSQYEPLLNKLAPRMNKRALNGRFARGAHYQNWIISLITACLWLPAANGDDWIRNLRITADLSGSAKNITKGSSNFGGVSTAGIDIHSTITEGDRNVATTVVQLYLVKAYSLGQRPAFLTSENDWKLMARVNTINFHLTGDGRLNFLIGHPELNYGLESSIDTNGTLRQFTNGSNLGLKTDWGLGLNGDLTKLTYAISVTRGSGLDYAVDGDPWAITARFGSRQGSQAFFGVNGIGASAFTGKVQQPTGGFVERTRVGIDGQWYHGWFGMMSEISVGTDDGSDITNGLIELNALSRNGSVTTYLQSRWEKKYRLSVSQESTSLAVGLRYQPTSKWTLSAQYKRKLNPANNQETDGVFDLQIRRRR
ncbi:MAG: hypothetical protein ACJAWK_000621 [Candidatus Azotimanducaceae bacterium]